MRIADHPRCVDHRDERHAAHLEDVDFLFVSLCNGVTRIGKTNERKLLRIPISAERQCRVWPNGYHISPAAREFLVLIAQARQLRAAIRSEEATQKGQDDRLPSIICKSDQVAVWIGQLEFRCSFTRAH